MPTAEKTVSREQEMIARLSGSQEVTATTLNDDEAASAVADGIIAAAPTMGRKGPRRVVVYKLTPSGCLPIEVSSNALGGNEGVLNNGCSATCFDCGRGDCCTDVKTWAPNQCPGRPARLYRSCPVCAKRVYDSHPTGKFLRDAMAQARTAEAAENEITDDSYSDSTPQTRTKVMLDLHIVGYHPVQAMEMGVRIPMLTPAAQREAS